MSLITNVLLRSLLESLLKGLFDYMGERARDRELIQSGVNLAEKNNAIKTSKKIQRMLKAASNSNTDDDVSNSLHDGSF